MTIRQIIKSILTPNTGISSKRVFGGLGFIVIFVMYIICTITQKKLPEYTDDIIYTSAALLGVDSITNIWKKNQ